MPSLSVYLIRVSLIHLGLGFTFGALILLQKGLWIAPDLWRLLIPHREIVIFGWIIQFVIGVAFWMLPRFNTPPARGNELLVWIAFVLLNAGLILVCAETFLVQFRWLGLSGRLLEALAVILFVIHLWPRIRPFGDKK